LLAASSVLSRRPISPEGGQSAGGRCCMKQTLPRPPRPLRTIHPAGTTAVLVLLILANLLDLYSRLTLPPGHRAAPSMTLVGAPLAVSVGLMLALALFAIGAYLERSRERAADDDDALPTDFSLARGQPTPSVDRN